MKPRIDTEPKADAAPKTEEAKYRYDFEEMPLELLVMIITRLTPEHAAQSGVVSKKFSRATTAQLFWGTKFQLHFPYLYKHIEDPENINWYKAFLEAYETEYPNLSPSIRKIFSMVKERDLAGLEKSGVTALDILQYIDAAPVEPRNLVLTAIKYHHQPILDFFYNLLKTLFMIDDHHAKPPLVNVMNALQFAIILHQPVNELIFLIAAGVPVDTLGHDSATALHIAAERGYIEAVNTLLARDANVDAMNVNSVTALRIAAQFGHLEIVKTLIAKNANINIASVDGVTPLYSAAAEGHHDIVKELLAKDAENINVTASDGSTPLSIAILHGHLAVVKALLAKNANIEVVTDGLRPLILAAKNGLDEIVKVLLANKADIDAVTNTGCSALHVAAQNGHLGVVRALLANNANIDLAYPANGATPLLLAIQGGYLDIVMALLAKNPNVNAATIKGGTPLRIAVNTGQLEVVKALLAHDVVIDERSLVLAKKKGYTEIEKMMKIKVLENYIKSNGAESTSGHLRMFNLFQNAQINDPSDNLAAAKAELEKLKLT